MKGVKDEGKRMVTDHPLFPRFHVNDADRGGPRAPQRNKMALSEQRKHSVSTQNLRYNSGSMKLLHLPPSNGSYSTYNQPPPSSNAGNPEGLTGSSHSADLSNYSGGLNLNISLKNSEPPMSGNTNDQNPRFSGESMRINDYATSTSLGGNKISKGTEDLSLMVVKNCMDPKAVEQVVLPRSWKEMRYLFFLPHHRFMTQRIRAMNRGYK